MNCSISFKISLYYIVSAKIISIITSNTDNLKINLSKFPMFFNPDAHSIIDRILYLLTVHITNNEIIVLVKLLCLVNKVIS